MLLPAIIHCIQPTADKRALATARRKDIHSVYLERGRLEQSPVITKLWGWERTLEDVQPGTPDLPTRKQAQFNKLQLGRANAKQ